MPEFFEALPLQDSTGRCLPAGEVIIVDKALLVIHPCRFMNIQYCAHPHAVLMPLDITQCLRVLTVFPCKQASKGRQNDGPA